MDNITITDSEYDFSLLEKLKSHDKIWGAKISDENAKKLRKLRTNFVLHPRKLHSESSDNSEMSISPEEKLFSPKIVKSMGRVKENSHQTKVRTVLTDNHTNKVVPPLEVDKIGDFDGSKPMIFRRKSNLEVNRSNFDKKYKIAVEKTINTLKEIKVLIEKGISLPDGEDDNLKRHKRLQEFSARFARIYVYPSMRQTNDLSIPDKLSRVQINQKILGAQQTILQGLQAYYHHLPTSTGNCCVDKLKNLLEQQIYLCQIVSLLRNSKYATIGELDEFVNAVRTHTEIVDESLDDFLSRRNEPIKKVPSRNGDFGKKRKISKKPGRYSMYGESASFRRDLAWRKAVESLAKKKFNVKSRYKTATFKHRPPLSPKMTDNDNKLHLLEMPSKSKLFPKRSSGILKNTPIDTPTTIGRNDDIETMVQQLHQQEERTNKHLVNHRNHEEVKLVRDNDRDVDTNSTSLLDPSPPLSSHADDGVGKALEFLKNQGQDFLLKVVEEMARKQSQELQFVVRKEPSVISITGPKNAQLICMKDENSLIDDDGNGDDENHKIDKEVMTEKELVVTSSETQTDLRRNKVKISRLPRKNMKNLDSLPRNYAINIIQYKLEFRKFSKLNPMYEKNAKIPPWVLMGRISDDILDDLLLSTVKELEVNDILENLYRAEFQY